MAERKNFGKLTDALEAPDLIEIQLNSYKEFLQLDVAPSKRKKMGLQAVLSEAFPIESYDCLLYTSPSPRDSALSRMPSSA